MLAASGELLQEEQMRSRVVVAVLVMGAALGLAAVPAGADQRIEAAAPQRYTTPQVTMAQGERLTFANSDIAMHDVTAAQAGPDGAPLFASPLIAQGQEAFVDGSQYLTTGTYAFVCSIHANMTGSLTVTADGTPVPRPGVGGTPADTTAPKVSAAVKTGTLRKARKDKALTIVVTLDEAAKIVAKATTGGTTLATARTSVGSGATKLRIALKAAARARLKAGRAVSIKVTATDAAGNRSTKTVKRTLR
jgi:plastocyanin